METKPIAWSHSALNTFNNCPKRYYEEKVAKSVRATKSDEILWGERVHRILEHRLKDNTPIDESLSYLEPVAARLGETKGAFSAEQKLAINQSFQPTEWFAPDVWCRAVLDAVWLDGETARIVDWKSGKRKLDSNQLRLFALMYFAHHPEVERVNSAFVWLKTGQVDVEKFKREDIPVLWQEILPEVRRLEYAHKTQTWVPKPSGLCNYCPVRQCSFWRSENGTGNQRGRR